MKVKIITANMYKEIKEEFEEFAKGKDIISVSATELMGEDDFSVTYHIFYKEIKMEWPK